MASRLLALGVVLVVACNDGQRLAVDMGTADQGPPDLTGGNAAATRCVALNTPKLLSNLPGSHAYPRLGFTGTNYVAAWNSSVDVNGTIKHRIDVSLVDKDGNRL